MRLVAIVALVAALLGLSTNAMLQSRTIATRANDLATVSALSTKIAGLEATKPALLHRLSPGGSTVTFSYWFVVINEIFFLPTVASDNLFSEHADGVFLIVPLEVYNTDVSYDNTFPYRDFAVQNSGRQTFSIDEAATIAYARATLNDFNPKYQGLDSDIVYTIPLVFDVPNNRSWYELVIPGQETQVLLHR